MYLWSEKKLGELKKIPSKIFSCSQNVAIVCATLRRQWSTVHPPALAVYQPPTFLPQSFSLTQELNLPNIHCLCPFILYSRCCKECSQTTLYLLPFLSNFFCIRFHEVDDLILKMEVQYFICIIGYQKQVYTMAVYSPSYKCEHVLKLSRVFLYVIIAVVSYCY